MATIQDNIRQSVKFGEIQVHDGMAVFPLFCSIPAHLEYISLKQAMLQQQIVITEISQGGSVPNLKVINNGTIPVLLLDGEEVAGAKQNRILNTSILLMEKSETIIPVSCTERGRWSYDKPGFEDSGNVMTAQMRAEKLSSVSNNLKSSSEFRSDQGQVWANIDQMQHKMGVHSPTSALRDVFTKAESRVKQYQDVYVLQEGQCGIAVCFGERVIGLDYVSEPDVWKDLHAKLVKSYALEYVMSDKAEGECAPVLIDKFLDKLLGLYPEMFKSVGYGEDYRFIGSDLIGSALYWQETVIHLEAYSRSNVVHETAYHSPRRRHNEFYI